MATQRTSRPSMQQLVRNRRESGFVGRRAELGTYRDNLATAPEDPEHLFLFHVHGVSGVGKTTLVRQFERAARERGALTAYVDEGVHSVIDAMETVSGQLAQQDAPLKDFDKLLARYRERRHEADSVLAAAGDPAAAGGGPAPGAASATSTVLASAGVAGLELIPAVGPLASRAVDPAQLAQSMDRWRAALSTRLRSHDDVQLVLSPVRALTPVFLAGLEEAAERVPWIALFFDTYERTGPVLDSWLHAVATTERYGLMPGNALLTLSGQQPPDPARWARSAAFAAGMPLELFTEAETRQLLATEGVTDERVIEIVLRLSGGLPVLTSMLAGARPGTPADIGDPSGTAVERFLKWIDDPALREVAQAAAFPLELDEDVFRVAGRGAGESSAADCARQYAWLRTLPFVQDRSGRAQYHDVVRGTMLRFQHNRSPRRWREQHRRLAEHFARRGAELAAGRTGEAIWEDADWREQRALETYHLLCADPRGALRQALDGMAWAVAESASAARGWARTLARAATDTGDAALADWAARLGEALTGHTGGTPSQAELFGVLLEEPGLDARQRADLLARRVGARLTHGGETEAAADLERALALDPECVRARGWRGRLRADRGGFAEALEDFDLVLAHDPDSPAMLDERGRVYAALGRYAEGLVDFTRSLELVPGDVWTLRMRAACLDEVGRHEEALAELDAALEIDPEYVEALAERVDILRCLGRYEEASGTVTRLLGLETGNQWVLTSLGVNLRLLGRYEEALTCLHRALSHHPDHQRALYQRGVLLRVMHRYDEALADLDRARELAPDDRAALSARAETCRLAGRTEEALEGFDRALRDSPENVYDLGSRAQCLSALGRWPESVDGFAAALALAPRDEWLLEGWVEALRLGGLLDGALADTARRLARAPGDLDARLALVYMLAEAERYDEALAELTVVCEAEPDEERWLVDRASLHELCDHEAEARADLDRALLLAPGSVAAHRGLGLHHRRAGRLDEALIWLNRAVALNPARDWSHYLCGETHWLRGDGDTALAALGTACGLDPAFPLHPARRAHLVLLDGAPGDGDGDGAGPGAVPAAPAAPAARAASARADLDRALELVDRLPRPASWTPAAVRYVEALCVTAERGAASDAARARWERVLAEAPTLREHSTSERTAVALIAHAALGRRDGGHREAAGAALAALLGGAPTWEVLTVTARDLRFLAEVCDGTGGDGDDGADGRTGGDRLRALADRLVDHLDTMDSPHGHHN